MDDDPFILVKGSKAFIILCPDDNKHYARRVDSEGYPMKIMELHSNDEQQAVATVFSYNLGRRFMIIFELADARPV